MDLPQCQSTEQFLSLSLQISIEYVKTCSLSTQAVVITSKDGTREFNKKSLIYDPSVPVEGGEYKISQFLNISASF